MNYDLSAFKGQTIQIYFNAHEDGAGDPTYMYLDDVSISGATPTMRFVPVTPCRVVDTRRAAGAFGGPSLAAGTSRDFPIVQGACDIPPWQRPIP